MNPRHSVPQTDALPTELHPPFARLSGLEPLTNGLEGRCSIQLSYRRSDYPLRKVASSYSLYRSAFKEPLRIPKMVGARGFEPPTTSTQNWCATRLRYTPPWMIRRRRKLTVSCPTVNEKVRLSYRSSSLPLQISVDYTPITDLST